MNLAKVDLLYCSHALKRRGLFENAEMKMQKPVLGGRAKATVPGEKIEYGKIIEVSPSGKRYQVEWDHPDECGQKISTHELHPASYVRPV